jgi:ketosteroid isomerase-like protein
MFCSVLRRGRVGASSEGDWWLSDHARFASSRRSQRGVRSAALHGKQNVLDANALHGKRPIPRDTARAMSEENVEIVRQIIATNRAEYRNDEARIEAFLALWDPNCEYTSVVAAVEPRTYRGHDGLRRYPADMADSWADWRSEVEEIIDAGLDTVFATIHTRITGKQSGVALDARLAMVFVFSAGKVLRARTYLDRREALEAAGLSE